MAAIFQRRKSDDEPMTALVKYRKPKHLLIGSYFEPELEFLVMLLFWDDGSIRASVIAERHHTEEFTEKILSVISSRVPGIRSVTCIRRIEGYTEEILIP